MTGLIGRRVRHEHIPRFEGWVVATTSSDTGQTLYLWVLDDEGNILRGDAHYCTVITVPAEPYRCATPMEPYR